MPKPSAPKPARPARDDLPQWPLGLAALLGGAAGWALWRRKSPAPAQTAVPDDMPIAPPEPNVPPPPAPMLQPPLFTAAPQPSTITLPAPVAPPAPLPPEEMVLDFIPTRFATTLTEAILRYRLTVTNTSDQPLGPLAITGTMEAAGQDEDHAPPAPKPQAKAPDLPFRPAPGFSPHPHFSPDPVLADGSVAATVVPNMASPDAPSSQDDSPPMPERHRLMILQPGETVDLRGQMRLPLAQIAPMRVGSAALFVPLVRLSLEAERIEDGPQSEALPPLTAQMCMVVGEIAPDQASIQTAALGPFRLDNGPAIARHLGARMLSMPAAEVLTSTP